MVGDGLSFCIVCVKYLCLDVRLKRNSDNLLNYTEVTVNNLLEVLQNVTFDRNKCCFAERDIASTQMFFAERNI